MCLNCIIKQIKFSQKIGNTQSVIDLTQQAKTELTRLIHKNIKIDKATNKIKYSTLCSFILSIKFISRLLFPV